VTFGVSGPDARSRRLGTHRDVFGLDLEEMTPAAFKNTLG